MNKIKKTFLIDIAIYLLLFLVAVNFGGYWFYLMMLGVCVALFKKDYKIAIDGAFFSLLVLSLSIIIFDPRAGRSLSTMLAQFAFPASYIFGYIFISNKGIRFDAKQAEKTFFVCMVIFGLGTLLHLGLNLYVNPQVKVFRQLVDFWSGEILSATGQAAFTCLPIALASMLIFSKSKLILKLLAAAVLVYIIWANFKIACRTIMVFVVVGLVVAGMYYLFTRPGFSKKVYSFAVLLIIMAGMVLAYQNNVLGIRAEYENSGYYSRVVGNERMELANDPRFDYKMEYVERMVKNPFGGSKTHREVRSYAHDLFLDTYDDASIFAFMAVVAFIIISVRNLIRVLKNKSLSFSFRQLFLCTSIICYCEFMIEPILKGMPWLLSLFCFMQGAAVSLMKFYNREDEEYEDCRD